MITGTFTKHSTREWNGKTLYTMLIQDDTGYEHWVGLGTDQPPYPQGVQVSVEAKKNAKGYWSAAARDVTLIASDTTTTPAPVAEPPAATTVPATGILASVRQEFDSTNAQTEVPTEAQAKPTASAAPARQVPVKRTSPDSRQCSIVLQSSYKTATDQANALLAAGLWKPAANTKAAKATAIDAYFGFVDQIAVSLYTKCTNPEDFLDQFLADQPAVESDSDQMFSEE